MRKYFNPHEREARDIATAYNYRKKGIILIHTSVKLVTCVLRPSLRCVVYFNPHEREARDLAAKLKRARRANFNPHEREARDTSHFSVGIM